MDLVNYKIEDKLNNIELKGVSSSGSIAFGYINFLNKNKNSIKRKIKEDEIESEISIFEDTIKYLENEFQNISNNLNYEFDKIAEIYEMNILLLNDPIIIEEIKAKINNLYSAAYSINSIFNKFIKQLKSSEDLLLKERADLIEEIKDLLINKITIKDINEFNPNDIIVSKSIDTKNIFNIKEANASGFVCEEGGLTSHSAIIARAFNITSLINVKNLIRCSRKGDFAIIDSINGIFIINPNQETINKYKLIKEEFDFNYNELSKILKKESKTIDNKKIKIKSNLDNLIELSEYNVLNSDGLGLVRTEILFNTKEIFDEDFQTKKYTEISQKIYPNEVTIRVFDIGSDKYPDGFKFKESNPALGVRGIRFLLKNLSIFKKQITAILKSSELKNIKILIPMITNLDDVRYSLQIIDEVKSSLTESNIKYDKNIKIGFMIETPSAALMSKKIAHYADFLSIGTNDLSQYLFAADRTNQECSKYLNNNSPILFNLIKNIVDNAHKENVEVSVCGEIAYDINFTKLLIGTGVDELSLSYSNIPKIKNELINSNYKDCKKMLEDFIEKES